MVLSGQTKCLPDCEEKRRLSRDSHYGICPKCKAIFRATEIVTFHDLDMTAGKLLDVLEKDLAGLRASNDTLIRPVIEADVEALKRYGVTRARDA